MPSSRSSGWHRSCGPRSSAPVKARRCNRDERTQIAIAFARCHRATPRPLAQMFGLTEQEAAADCGVTLKTYTRYAEGAQQRTRPLLTFAWKHRVNLDWLICGDG